MDKTLNDYSEVIDITVREGGNWGDSKADDLIMQKDDLIKEINEVLASEILEDKKKDRIVNHVYNHLDISYSYSEVNLNWREDILDGKETNVFIYRNASTGAMIYWSVKITAKTDDEEV